MHYLFPFLSSQLQTKVVVTISSSILIFIAILYTAYSSRYIQLSRAPQGPSSRYKDPLVPFMLFYGILSILTHTLNLIQLWKEDLIAISKNIKWWSLWWLLFINSAFTFTCAIGGAQNIFWIKTIESWAYMNLSWYLPSSANDYYYSWISLNRLSIPILILQYLLGIPVVLLLMAGLVSNLKKPAKPAKPEIKISEDSEAHIRIEASKR